MEGVDLLEFDLLGLRVRPIGAHFETRWAGEETGTGHAPGPPNTSVW